MDKVVIHTLQKLIKLIVTDLYPPSSWEDESKEGELNTPGKKTRKWHMDRDTQDKQVFIIQKKREGNTG